MCLELASGENMIFAIGWQGSVIVVGFPGFENVTSGNPKDRVHQTINLPFSDDILNSDTEGKRKFKKRSGFVL